MPRHSEATVRIPDWPTILETTSDTLEQARDLVRRVQDRSHALVPLAGHPLDELACEDWSPAWAERTLDRAVKLGVLARVACETANEVRRLLDYPGTTATRTELQNLFGLVESLLVLEPVSAAFLESPWRELSFKLFTWIAHVSERSELRGKLAEYDEAKLLALDLVAIKARLQSAQTDWFLVKWLKIGAVRNLLRMARSDHARPEAQSLAEIVEWGLR